MSGIAIQFILLLVSLAQSPVTTPLRGGAATELTEQDIAALQIVLPPGEKPWLLIGDRSLWTRGQFIQAYLPPTTSTAALRRGTMIRVGRRNQRNAFERPASSDPWIVERSESYAQVAIAGRNFDRIQGDQDMNRPFQVIGRFDDTELVRLVEAVRSSPTPRGSDPADASPLVSIDRKSDDSAEIRLRRDAFHGQVLWARRAGQDWTVVVVGMWAY